MSLFWVACDLSIIDSFQVFIYRARNYKEKTPKDNIKQYKTNHQKTCTSLIQQSTRDVVNLPKTTSDGHDQGESSDDKAKPATG